MEEEIDYELNGLEPYEPIPRDSLGKVLLDSLMRDGDDNDALVDALTGVTLSYKDILQRSCNLAEALRIYGTGADSIHLMCSENNNEFFIAVLACIYLGCTVVPVNHNYTKNELSNIIRLTQPTIIFCSQAVVEKIVECREKYIDKIIVIDSTNSVSGAETVEEFVATLLKGFSVSPQNFLTLNNVNPSQHVALIMSSSGTTGLPKGVMVTQEMILVSIARSRHPQITTPTQEVGVLGLLPFFHSYGMLVGITSIVNRKKFVVMNRFDEKTFLGTIQDYRITSTSLVPVLINFIATTTLLDDYDLSSVVEVFCAGSALNSKIQQIFMKRLKISTIRQVYGLTETMELTITNPGGTHKPGSCGKLVPYMKLKVIDHESGRSLGPNQTGEIYIKGPVMKGYYKNQEATRESFTPDGWFKSGDVGYYDEDEDIFIVDRLKELIKYKGYQEQLCKSSLRQAAGPRLIQSGNQLQTGFGIIGPHQCSLGFHGCMHAGSYCPSSFAEMNTAIDHRIHLGDRLESTPEGHFEYEMVAPAELEAILTCHPKVLDAGVVGVPDDEAGELPMAFVVKQNGIDVSEKDLQDYVAEKVSPQKRLRGGIMFVAAIPKNASGKILRRELRKYLPN